MGMGMVKSIALTRRNHDGFVQVYTGFEEDPSGSFLYGSAGVLTVCWLIVMLSIIVTSYNLHAKEEFRMLNVVFVWVWHVMLTWLLSLKFFSSSIQNFFRLRVPMNRVRHYPQAHVLHPHPHLHLHLHLHLHPCRDIAIYRECCFKATVIQIWERGEKHSLTESNAVVQFVRKVQTAIRHQFGGIGSYHNEPVNVTNGSTRFFEHKCRRYSYDATTDSWRPVMIAVAQTYAQMARLGRDGLTEDEAQWRLELQGLNEVTVKVQSIPHAIFSEFYTGMYIYQLQCLFVWMYVQLPAYHTIMGP